jgi:UDP-N-acetylmuramoylalanine--D-glutamate ligase
MTIDPRHPLPGRRPLVVGAGRSGLAAARLLAAHGLEVRLCDRRPRASCAQSAGALDALGVESHWERDDAALLEGRDFVVWSPGIALGHPIAVAAAAAALPLLSELELGFLAAHAPFVCVTGTNGKSTTTDVVGALVRAAGRECAVCGNIGRAVCEVAERVSPAGLLIVEVSSFQLETVERLRPFVATWLNLTPDHLDRHRDLDTYGGLKQRLFRRQEETDYAVWNADDPEVMSRRTGGGTPLLFSSRGAVDPGAYVADGAFHLAWRGGTERVLGIDELRLRGAHNVANVAAALATTLPLEIAPATLRAVLRDYSGLEHRLESVAVVDGVEFVNDSKATNVGSMEVALASFERPVVLIAGGRDKGQDFGPLAGRVKRSVRHLVLIGEGAGRIGSAWSAVAQSRAGSLAEAVDLAFDLARRSPGGPSVVLLSPGCASFDMFEDFEDRGRRFKAEVGRLKLMEAGT